MRIARLPYPSPEVFDDFGCPAARHRTSPVRHRAFVGLRMGCVRLESVGRTCLRRRQDDGTGAERHPAMEIDNVLVQEPDAAARHRLTDRARFYRSVDAVERVTL